MSDEQSYLMTQDHADDVQAQSQGLLSLAREAWFQRDFDTARMAYQKCAYVSSRLRDDDTRAALKLELSGFARSDPLYKEVLAAIRPVVDQSPGIKQTDLYGCVGFDRETVSYVLYYAAELFDLYRKKAGRTYQIFPPGHLIEPASKQMPGRPS